MKKLATIIFWAGVLAVIASLLLFYESDFLWKVQEMNLFLDSSLFFKEQMVTSGGLLVWLGAYFTQFFYHPWQGVLLLCGWWLLLMWLTKRAFRIPNGWAALMLIPVALLLLTVVDMGYWIYFLKLRGHVFLATIGTTLMVALLWGFRSIPDNQPLRASYIFLVCVAGYPLMGISGLAAAALMGIWSWRLERKKTYAIICSAVALVSAIAVPLIFYRYVYYQTNIANIYVTALPLYYITEEYHDYYLPFYLLAAFFVLLALTYQSERKKLEGKIWTWIRIGAQCLILGGLAWGVNHYWYKDENFHHELAMQHSMEQHDWAGIVEEARQQVDEPTRAIVMMRNIALARLGRQGEEMFLFKNGSKRYEAPFDMRLMLVAGPQIYYQYGMLNYCNRLCVEMGVEFNWRPEYLKLMVKCAILNGDQSLARKYIGLLKQTTFFGDWATWAEDLMAHPEQIAQDPELEPITHMMHYDNVLGSDQGYVERFLMRQLARSTYTEDPVFQEQTLLATLWTHDINEFWFHFADYVRLHPDARIPRYYQEAAYLYCNIEGRDVDRMPFDASVKEGFDRFMQSAAYYNDAEVDVAYKGLYGAFGQTYYFDYYIMSHLPEY